MDKKKPKGQAAKVQRTAKKGIQFYTDDEMASALDRFLADQQPDQRPTKRAVLETALANYLQAKGYWPPPQKK